jgi:hypothetical protein
MALMSNFYLHCKVMILPLQNSFINIFLTDNMRLKLEKNEKT